MNRITIHQMFMQMAHVAARRSTCLRLNVGAAIAEGKHIVSTGYNGASSGKPHCTEVGCGMQEGSCVRTVHAEMNALRFSSGQGDRLYVTHAPCLPCARAIIQVGWWIKSVFFDNPYRGDGALLFFIKKGVKVYRLVPNGFVIDYATGSVVDPDTGEEVSLEEGP